MTLELKQMEFALGRCKAKEFGLLESLRVVVPPADTIDADSYSGIIKQECPSFSGRYSRFAGDLYCIVSRSRYLVPLTHPTAIIAG